jgi:nucleotide-binding universal stress UspA family protein
MHTVLLHMHDDIGQRSRAAAALALARALPAHLLCLQTLALPVGLEPVRQLPSLAHAAGEARIAGARALAELQQAALETDLAAAGLSVEWHRHEGDAREALRRYALLADLVVVSRAEPPAADAPPLALAAEVALHLDIPALVVPAGLEVFDPTRPAVVAWDGSQAAAAALRAAVPLLRRSATVAVLTVNDADRWEPSADAAVAYLVRAGVRASVSRLDNVADVAEALLAAAARTSASFLTMGMYGHGRARERLLGGVTQSILGRASIPLLLAH